MTAKAIGAIPASPDSKSAGVDIGSLNGERTVVVIAADEQTPMTEEAWRRIVEELSKPRFAFERTFDGARYTRRMK